MHPLIISIPGISPFGSMIYHFISMNRSGIISRKQTGTQDNFDFNSDESLTGKIKGDQKRRKLFGFSSNYPFMVLVDLVLRRIKIKGGGAPLIDHLIKGQFKGGLNSVFGRGLVFSYLRRKPVSVLIVPFCIIQ